MTLIAVNTITPERELQALINHKIARLDHWRPAMNAVSKAWYRHQQGWFASQGQGSWPALKPATVAQKAREGWPAPSTVLYRSGDLYDSVTSPDGPYSIFEVGERMLEIGLSGGPWPYHHHGMAPNPVRRVFNVDAALVAKAKSIVRFYARQAMNG